MKKEDVTVKNKHVHIIPVEIYSYIYFITVESCVIITFNACMIHATRTRLRARVCVCVCVCVCVKVFSEISSFLKVTLVGSLFFARLLLDVSKFKPPSPKRYGKEQSNDAR